MTDALATVPPYAALALAKAQFKALALTPRSAIAAASEFYRYAHIECEDHNATQKAFEHRNSLNEYALCILTAAMDLLTETENPNLDDLPTISLKHTPVSHGVPGFDLNIDFAQLSKTPTTIPLQKMFVTARSAILADVDRVRAALDLCETLKNSALRRKIYFTQVLTKLATIETTMSEEEEMKEWAYLDTVRQIEGQRMCGTVGLPADPRNSFFLLDNPGHQRVAEMVNNMNTLARSVQGNEIFASVSSYHENPLVKQVRDALE